MAPTGKPPIGEGITSAAGRVWTAAIRRLASLPNVMVKLSGLPAEAPDTSYESRGYAPWLREAVDAFGAARAMFGSDWPVCTVATAYDRWVDTVENWTAQLSDAERGGLWGGTAIDAYNLVSSRRTAG